MGQRLTIQVYDNQYSEESLATIYYHWSAYTVSALQELERLVATYKEKSQTFNRRAALYAATLEHGGGLEDWAKDSVKLLDDPKIGQKEKDSILTNYNKFKETLDLDPQIKELYENVQKSASRNEGLISFTQKAQEDTMYWSEGNIELYLDEEAFDFDVFISLSPEEFYDEYKDWSNYFENYDPAQDFVKYLEKNHTLDIDTSGNYLLEDIPMLIEAFEDIEFFYDKDSETVIIPIA